MEHKVTTGGARSRNLDEGYRYVVECCVGIRGCLFLDMKLVKSCSLLLGEI